MTSLIGYPELIRLKSSMMVVSSSILTGGTVSSSIGADILVIPEGFGEIGEV